MRQVMPHRNNIVVDHRRCKPFLHAPKELPTELEAVLHSCQHQADSSLVENKSFGSMIYIERAERGMAQAVTNSISRYAQDA